ncbi:excinuclease ABC subunit C [Endozoicomonas sp. (ex Bugula neritina AB1)]|nr:excinuclease ABC subunit C [Endozoicomonas sp. (ex Bugula neritina AB1)]
MTDPALNKTASDEKAFDAKAFLAKAPLKPGVYDMRDAEGKTLYIGKAKNLKNRLGSYFRATGLTTKTMALVSKIADIDLTITNSETEALLLEQNLIKDRKPPYNILLKDGKAYPFIYLSNDDDFPRIASHRGRKRKKGEYFGPFPSSHSVKESLYILQKIFKIRQCEDSYFRNRTRPCLQHQIGRCKAPCVNLVSEEEYARDVDDTRQFLLGKNQSLIRSLIKRMEKESEALQFEQAAGIRDQINHLRVVQEQQSVTKAAGDVDVIGYAEISGAVGFDVLFIRGGRVLGHKNFQPDFKLDAERGNYLAAFMAQFYIRLAESRSFPSEVILPFEFEGQKSLSEAMAQVAKRKVVLKHKVRSERLNWQQLAGKNAEQSLQALLSSKSTLIKRSSELGALLSFGKPVGRMECFDISHTMGEATVASCVVFNEGAPVSSEYRKFNITGIEPGDDYGAMRSALTRRYQKLSANDSSESGTDTFVPDLILIDGGKGQLSIANEVMEGLGLTHIPLLGVAKGFTRKPGLETLFYKGKEVNPEGREPALLLIQHIRDEAHRFAITGHRQRRQATRNRSILEDIPGIGSKRRSALLKFFGGRQGVMTATLDELAKVEGINHKLAQQIHDFLHND